MVNNLESGERVNEVLSAHNNGAARDEANAPKGGDISGIPKELASEPVGGDTSGGVC